MRYTQTISTVENLGLTIFVKNKREQKRKKLREVVCKDDDTTRAKFIYFYERLVISQTQFQPHTLLWEGHDFSQWKLVDLSLLWLCKRIYTPCFHVKYTILMMCFAQEYNCRNYLA